MDRTFYYVAIALFGVINGLFNQLWVLFALLHVQILSPALLFGSVGLTLMFSSLMVSTATIIIGGIPAALYEHYVGAGEDSKTLRRADGADPHPGRTSPMSVGKISRLTHRFTTDGHRVVNRTVTMLIRAELSVDPEERRLHLPHPQAL